MVAEVMVAGASNSAPAKAAEAPLVEVQGVDLSFGAVGVLKRVNLTVQPGELVTLIGPNGAGKTSLVRVVLGLQRPDRGRVLLRPRLHIGYVPQQLAVDPVLPLTVRRFLSLGGKSSHASQEAGLDEVGVAHLIGAPLQTLSGGELRRVVLARALLRDPDLLVLDEPVEGVDVTGQVELYELIAELRQRRDCGVLMVSHDLHLVMAATDRVVCLNHHVCCAGRPEAVRRDPEYIALFGTRAAGALALYAHDHDHVHAPSGDVVPVEGDAEESAAGEGRHG
jgi:zinc transport system ATP-binding protein